MRFAITAMDRYVGVFDAFVRAGWQPLKLFTVPIENAIDNHKRVAAFAEEHGAAVQLTRMSEPDMRELSEQSCDALIVASYGWKIGPWEPFFRYAVNFHSSPLPEGRGPYPLHRAILENRSSWAITCHRLTAEIDSGDILSAEHFLLQADEYHQSLDLKVQLAANRLAARVARTFVDLWAHARPQGEGSYWPLSSFKDRVIDFGQPVEVIARHVRAFGETGSLAKVNETWLGVTRAVCWQDRHLHRPGDIVHVYNSTIVVAGSDGYVGILEANIADPQVVAGLG